MSNTRNNHKSGVCPDPGEIRMLMDHELDNSTKDEIANHVAICKSCTTALEYMKADREFTQRQLAIHIPASHPDLALQRFHSVAADGSASPGNRAHVTHHYLTRIDEQSAEKPREFITKMKKYQQHIVAGITAIAAISAVTILPPVRAASDQFFALFRTQSTVFLPVNPQRLREIASHRDQIGALLDGRPTFTGNLRHPKLYATKLQADSASGQLMQLPRNIEAMQVTPTFEVVGPLSASAKFNVGKINILLTALGIDDIHLPTEAKSIPVHVKIAPVEIARYSSGASTLTVIEGNSPVVTLPKNVDLAEVGEAGLRILGMSKGSAHTLSSQINWASTLVFPFPDSESAHQVTVNGVPALLISRHSARRSSVSTWALYWQRGGKFYVATGRGINDQALVAIASSI